LKKVEVVSQSAGVEGTNSFYEGTSLTVIENVDGRLIVREKAEAIAVYNKDCWSHWRKTE
jgi:hypothetical protein